MRKRKKKLTEFVEACGKERERRQNIASDYIQLPAFARKPTKSKLRIDIPVTGTYITFTTESDF